MKRFRCLAIPLMTLLVFHSGTLCLAQHSARTDQRGLLIGTTWLRDHLSDPSIVVLHVSSSIREYRKGHIPGARFLWTQALAQSSPELTLELPSPLQADTLFRNLGLNPGDRVVLVSSGTNVPPVTRVLFTLEQLGLRGRVFLLDGGLEGWKAAGGLISQETPSVKPGSLKSVLQLSGVVDADWIMKRRQHPGVKIVDARAAQFYQGNAGGMPRGGHIPGAVSIPFSAVLDSTNKVKDDSTLAALFRNAGIGAGDTVVTYCHIGQQATVLYLVARQLGYEAMVYDGSFEDWSMRDDLPVATGQKGD